MIIFGANHGCVMLFDLFESAQWGLDVFMVKYDQGLNLIFMIKYGLSVIMT